MGTVIATGLGAASMLPSSKSLGLPFGMLSHVRSPSDPYYYADVTIENIVVGSSWLIGYTPVGGVFTSLASGTAAATTVVASLVPSYASPMQLELRVRKSSSAPKYEPLKQFTNHSKNGSGFYISQLVDDVAS